MILITQDCDELTSTTGDDELLIPIIEKLYKFWSITLAGT